MPKSIKEFVLWLRNMVGLNVLVENQAAAETRFAELERRLAALAARHEELAALHNKFHDAVEQTLHARFFSRVRLAGTLNKLLSDDDRAPE